MIEIVVNLGWIYNFIHISQLMEWWNEWMNYCRYGGMNEQMVVD